MSVLFIVATCFDGSGSSSC